MTTVQTLQINIGKINHLQPDWQRWQILQCNTPHSTDTTVQHTAQHRYYECHTPHSTDTRVPHTTQHRYYSATHRTAQILSATHHTALISYNITSFSTNSQVFLNDESRRLHIPKNNIREFSGFSQNGLVQNLLYLSGTIWKLLKEHVIAELCTISQTLTLHQNKRADVLGIL